MYDILLTTLTAFLITYFTIPSVIKIAVEKNLVDEPGERRSHSKSIPTLGGFSIFVGLIFSVVFWTPVSEYIQEGSNTSFQYILCAYIIIFMIGAKDDIIPLPASKKFMGQLLASCILVYFAKIQLTSLYGIFGIYEIPQWSGALLTIFTIIIITNSFNLIDGINALASIIGCIVCFTFGYWFFLNERYDMAILAAGLIGSLIAFLRYNSESEIFMGDTGSLLIGLTASILSITFIQSNISYVNEFSIQSAPAVAIGILIIPLFDTLRVFTLRVISGKSPFDPDRLHIHHLLIDLGLPHLMSAYILAFTNLTFILVVFTLNHIGTLELALLILFLATALTTTIKMIHYRKSLKSKNV